MPQSTTIHSVPARWNYRRSCSLLSYDAVIYIKRRPAIKTTDDFAQYIKKAKSKKIIVANNALKNIISEMFPNAEVTVGINLRESVNMLQTSTKLLAIVPAYRIDVSFFFMCLVFIFKALIHRVNVDVYGKIRIQFSFLISAPLLPTSPHRREVLYGVMLKGSLEGQTDWGLLGIRSSA